MYDNKINVNLGDEIVGEIKDEANVAVDGVIDTEVDDVVDDVVDGEIDEDDDYEDDDEDVEDDEYPFDESKATLVSSRPLYPPCCHQVYEELYRDEDGDYWLCCDEYCDLPYEYLSDSEAAEWLEQYGTAEEYEEEFGAEE